MRTAERARHSRQVAVGGMFSSLSLLFLFSASLLPIATYLAPILAGFALLPVFLELGTSTALVAFCAVSFLSAFTVTDVEAVAMFIAFFGWYPILRGRLRRIKPKLLRGIVKALIFNAAICAAYGVLIFLFSMQAIAEELRGYLAPLLLLFGNVLLFFYDRLLGHAVPLYFWKLRPKLIGKGSR